MRSVQIPDEVYQQASKLAEQDHVSVDKLVTALICEGVGDWERLKGRAVRGSTDRLKAVLAKVTDAEPDSMDQL